MITRILAHFYLRLVRPDKALLILLLLRLDLFQNGSTEIQILDQFTDLILTIVFPEVVQSNLQLIIGFHAAFLLAFFNNAIRRYSNGLSCLFYRFRASQARRRLLFG